MSKNLLAVAVVVACCLAVIWFSTSIQGSQKTYEIKPHITAPEYRTDAARAIDAYERLMERYMGLTEKNLLSFGTDIRNVITKIDSIDDKLTQLGARIAQIEKALGIELAPASTDTSQDRQQSNLSVKGKKQQKSPVEKD
jgi:hypothetical protein